MRLIEGLGIVAGVLLLVLITLGLNEPKEELSNDDLYEILKTEISLLNRTFGDLTISYASYYIHNRPVRTKLILTQIQARHGL
jgi:hypothetical protein